MVPAWPVLEIGQQQGHSNPQGGFTPGPYRSPSTQHDNHQRPRLSLGVFPGVSLTQLATPRPPSNVDHDHHSSSIARNRAVSHTQRLVNTFPGTTLQPPNDLYRSQLHGASSEDALDHFDRQLLGFSSRPMDVPLRHHAPQVSLPFAGVGDLYSSHPARGTEDNPGAHHLAPATRDTTSNSLRPSPATPGILNNPYTGGRLKELQCPSQQQTPPFTSSSEVRSQTRAAPKSSSSVGYSSPAAQAGRRRLGLGRHSEENLASSPQQLSLDHAPPIAHGIHLVNPRENLSDKCRSIFPFDLFNAVQSKCFDAVYNSNDNLVVSAPTGSGKTTILELAICRLHTVGSGQNFKVVYMAPTKALCAEKARDWDKKFKPLSLEVAELTGDTSHQQTRNIGKASIIVTTPEKWDSITRKWADHHKLLQLVELLLIDEVHILKDVRGATLEAVVSRMKTIGANIRFVALSATVPNSEDIANWLGRNHCNSHIPAIRETFGEELRPVQLRKYVEGYDHNGNDFMFDKFLNQKLPILISRHAKRKPILVFCLTRKSCESTAQTLAEHWSCLAPSDKTWPAPTKRIPVINNDLQEIVRFGVAYHHAGVDAQDRHSIEQNFLSGQLNVICCTSTLAVGINLPCHTVILKGTVSFTDSGPTELSDLDVMQMIGRAGRPQFDKSATAIILTRARNASRYREMISGEQILESTLHLNLIEHLNSEITLRTITDLASAKRWLSGTFLSIRLQRNPDHYRIGGALQSQTIDNKLEEICEKDIRLLQEAKLITTPPDPASKFTSTPYGQAMSKYMVLFTTMKLILTIPWGASLDKQLIALCKADEFKDIRFKPTERVMFQEINTSPFLVYPIREPVNSHWHKVFLLVQASLGCIDYPSSKEFNKVHRQLSVEKNIVLERMRRLIRCVIECKGNDGDGVGTRNSLELGRALSAVSWEGRAMQLTQVPQVGPVSMRKLVSHDIRTVLQLCETSFADIERIFSRNPPFGMNMLKTLEKFPRLKLDGQIIGRSPSQQDQAAIIVDVKANVSYIKRKCEPQWGSGPLNLTFMAETTTGELAYFWRGSVKKLDADNGLDLNFQVGLTKVDEQVRCHFSCEEVVGTIVSKVLRHSIPAAAFTQLSLAAKTIERRAATPFSNDLSEDDGLDEEDLINAVEYVEMKADQEPIQSLEAVDEEYTNIDEALEVVNPRLKEAGLIHDREQQAHNDPRPREWHPVRLPNGKYMCNHPCGSGGSTKTGEACKHKCCHEGIDRPRAPPQKKSVLEKAENGEITVYHLRSQVVGKDKASTQKRKAKHDHTAAPKKPKRAPTQKTSVEWDSDVEVLDLTGLDDDPWTQTQMRDKVQLPNATGQSSTLNKDDGSDYGSDVFDDDEMPPLGNFVSNAKSPNREPFFIDPTPIPEVEVADLPREDETTGVRLLPDEPSWLAEIDPEIVKLFRGSVNWTAD